MIAFALVTAVLALVVVLFLLGLIGVFFLSNEEDVPGVIIVLAAAVAFGAMITAIYAVGHVADLAFAGATSAVSAPAEAPNHSGAR